MSNEDCLGCHEDPELLSDDGRSVGVNSDGFKSSVHVDLSCVDCHDQPADFEDIPHFQVYRRVDCASCHKEATVTFGESFHGLALANGTPNAPSCCACHCEGGNDHQIQPLTKRNAEQACTRCHKTETGLYDTSVHAAAAQKGKNSPGCTGCHETHSAVLPPSTGAVNKLCQECHRGAMEQVTRGGHAGLAEMSGVISCASCHDVHATHKPHLDKSTLEACENCHPDYRQKFDGSIHEQLIKSNKMNCLSCHRTHQVSDAQEKEDFGCGSCHDEIEKVYRSSAHRLARLRGNRVAATCGDCHNGHHVLTADDPKSQVNHTQIPFTCGKCHTDKPVITSDFVRLPISLPSYIESIHGVGWKADKRTAVCSDCHGSHNLEAASSPTSTIHKENLAHTCGQCHREEARDYLGSVHGRAVAHGITDSPSCTDCHDEHLIFGVSDPRSSVSPDRQANETCAGCHEDPEMAARYGLPPGVIESYQDSYHGWAIKRGGKAVAICMDCHNTHDIRSALDPASSINKRNVVDTCGKCHPKSNERFAASYTHIFARDKMMVHDWVRIAYIILIALVLGGMALHNVIVFWRYLKEHYILKKSQPAVRRMTKSEIVQHLVLAVSFTALAVSGFALRFPDSWWANILTDWGFSEEIRRLFHRAMAVLLVAASVYHIIFLIATRYGRLQIRLMFPRFSDLVDFGKNIAYHLGRSDMEPRFGRFDYTQKAEYWALIWGTVLMSITGFVLWFPTIATNWLPAWVVRVCEVVHYYEAILAVSAIIIWHFFFVIFHPRQYPMSWIWINGRMSKEEWEHHHSRDIGSLEPRPEVLSEETHAD